MQQAVSAVRAIVRRHRYPLAEWPTPLQRLDGLQRALRCRTELRVKRDDLASFAFGGSKVRALEMLAGEAVASDADVLITSGFIQSNCARLTAALAATLGVRCILILAGEKPRQPTGNYLLCELFGAETKFVRAPDQRPAVIAQLAKQIVSSGGRPFIVPLSAATTIGVLAMAEAFFELLDQGGIPDTIFVASSSGATQAGLLLGAALAQLPTRIVGVSPDDSRRQVTARVRAWLRKASRLLRLKEQALSSIRVAVDDTYVQMTRARQQKSAASTIARFGESGLLLDPVYTAKAGAALIAALNSGAVQDAGHTVLWHTGGQPSLFI